MFGSLLTDSPDFNQDLWDYNKRVVQLTKLLPHSLIPRAYKMRDKLIGSIM